MRRLRHLHYDDILIGAVIALAGVGIIVLALHTLIPTRY